MGLQNRENPYESEYLFSLFVCLDPLDTAGGQPDGLTLVSNDKVAQIIDSLAHPRYKKVPVANANSPSL